MKPQTILYTEVKSPVDPLTLYFLDGVLIALKFQDREERTDRHLERHFPQAELRKGKAPTEAKDALDAYFAGDAKALCAIRLAQHGTPFQLSVWGELRRIPFGETRSYADIAEAIGKPAAVRAVGLANGANPIAIVVPCHRVVGKDGSLTGFGGGLERKAWLLEHEAAIAHPAKPPAQLSLMG